MNTIDIVIAEPLKYIEGRCEAWLDNTITDPDTGCLLYRGAKSKYGYGHTAIRGKWADIHVVVALYYLVLKEGKDVEQYRGLLVRHKCNTPACINYEHLVFGTKRDNALDAIAAGAWKDGESCYFAKLTAEQVAEMRELASKEYISQTRLARMYDVSQANVSHILRGNTWK